MTRFDIQAGPQGAVATVHGTTWLHALQQWLSSQRRPADTAHFAFEILAQGDVIATPPGGAAPIRIWRTRPVARTDAPSAAPAPPPLPSDTLDDPFARPAPAVARPLGAPLGPATAPPHPVGLTLAGLDTQAACAQVLDAAQAQTPCAAGTVFLIDPRDRALYFAVVRGPDAAALQHRRLPLEVGLVGASIRTRRSLNVSDPASDPRFARTLADAIGYTPQNLVCAPVLHGQRVFGAIELLDRTAPGPFSDEEEAQLRRAARALGAHLATC